MFPYKTSIRFDRNSSQALYLQLSNQLIQLFKDRTLAPGTKLPGTRTLAELLNIHRKTVVACYEELLLQGWVESIPKKGTFVHPNLPELYRKLEDSNDMDNEMNAHFSFYRHDFLFDKTGLKKDGFMYLNDGISDGRMAPIDEIARTYRRILGKKGVFEHLSYGSTYGNNLLREVLANYLNATRGLHISKDNILITRGSQMGIWLSSRLLAQRDDIIVVGNTNYGSANSTFRYHGANLKEVSVDQEGIVTSEIEALCEQRQVRAVYVTPHHHHPTTVVLSAERRIHLLNLAKQFNFAIIEDDYDYDFNYSHAPILPLSSHDTNGSVIYIGSICKTVAPVFRIGYLIAPKEFVHEASKLRSIIDRQGDALLELTFAQFIKSGDLDRHIRKVMKVYEKRRDLFCKLLKDELGDFLEFELPIGGMAVWAKINSKYNLEGLSELARKHKLELGDWERYSGRKFPDSFIRIGFASYNEEEMIELIRRFRATIDEIRGTTTNI